MEILGKENIYLDLDLENKDSIINYLANEMFEAGKITDFTDYVDAVFAREGEVSTSVGNGVAIPHGKSKVVLHPTVFFAKTKELVKWGEGEEDNVDLVFMIAVPENDKVNDHLRIMALLSRKLVNESFRDTLRGVASVEEAHKLFEEIL